ncbi:unnamed protein product, partial [Ranitomeya imitator]
MDRKPSSAPALTDISFTGLPGNISMTTCSTLLALGMMPLCLFLYTKTWVDSNSVIIPYDSIGIALVSLVVPVGFGMFVNYKWPRVAKIILKA